MLGHYMLTIKSLSSHLFEKEDSEVKHQTSFKFYLYLNKYHMPVLWGGTKNEIISCPMEPCITSYTAWQLVASTIIKIVGVDKDNT